MLQAQQNTVRYEVRETVSQTGLVRGSRYGGNVVVYLKFYTGHGLKIRADQRELDQLVLHFIAVGESSLAPDDEGR